MGPTRNDFAARVLKAHAGQQQRVLVRQQLDCELRKYLDKLGALEEQLDGGGPWQRIWALDGYAALCAYARNQERQNQIQLPAVDSLLPMLKEGRVSLAILEDSQHPPGELKLEYPRLRIRSIKLGGDPNSFVGSSIGASSDQIAVFAQLTDRDEAHYSPYNVVTPSALLISTLDSIMASREPSDEDLQLLVAFYWLEHDSQTVLTPGTFVDPNQLERLMTLPSSSNPWHFVSVAERRRAWSVKLKSYEIFERLKVISTKYFKGRFVLGFLLQVVTGKSSDPLLYHHPRDDGPPADGSDDARQPKTPPNEFHVYPRKRSKRSMLAFFGLR